MCQRKFGKTTGFKILNKRSLSNQSYSNKFIFYFSECKCLHIRLDKINLQPGCYKMAPAFLTLVQNGACLLNFSTKWRLPSWLKYKMVPVFFTLVFYSQCFVEKVAFFTWIVSVLKSSIHWFVFGFCWWTTRNGSD